MHNSQKLEFKCPKEKPNGDIKMKKNVVYLYIKQFSKIKKISYRHMWHHKKILKLYDWCRKTHSKMYILIDFMWIHLNWQNYLQWFKLEQSTKSYEYCKFYT